MQTKLKFVLCIINILINITIIVGCIYKEQHHKEMVQQPKQEIKRNLKTIEIKTDKGVDTQAIKPVSLGKFKLTAYCPCEICCGKWANNRHNGVVYGAIGEELKEGRSIAVDPDIIPYKTEVIINGNTYIAQDCGGGIKGNEIDIYFENHNDALEFGVQYTNIYINSKKGIDF